MREKKLILGKWGASMLLALGTAISAFGKPAVILLEAMSGPSSHIAIFKEQMEQRLIASPNFEIVDRSSIKATEREMELSQSDWTSDNGRSRHSGLVGNELHRRLGSRHVVCPGGSRSDFLWNCRDR